MILNKYIFTLSCPDQSGIVAKVTEILSRMDGFILELAQYGDLATNRFFMRCVFEMNPLKISSLNAHFSKSFPNAFSLQAKEEPISTMIMVSKQGHCLNHLLHQWKTAHLNLDIQSIISNHKDLQWMADWYQIPFIHLPLTKDTKKEQEEELIKQVQKTRTELIVLARYMQILSPSFTEQFFGKIINIHHSFLPSFKGARPYHQAHERGVKLIGATAHYVTDELDEGPIIEQEVIRVSHANSLKDFVQLGSDIESRVLARAIQYHSEKKVFINGKKTVVFN